MNRILLSASLFPLFLPGMALAHPGHIGGDVFAAGIGHPLGGADHVLAMVAVGLWAALMGGRAMLTLPLAFVTAMLVGGLAAAAGLPLPGVEPMILASIVALGAAAALALRPALAHAMAAVALFGLFHGHAHGAEGPAAGLALYAAGFALATIALHLAGVGLGLGLIRLSRAAVVRGLGGVTAMAGLALAIAG